MGMGKKKLKKKIKQMERDIGALTKICAENVEDILNHQCHCENYKPKTVQFKRYVPLPEIYAMHEGMMYDGPIKKLKEEVYEREAGCETCSKKD